MSKRSLEDAVREFNAWDLAEGLERCAIGYRLDADRYLGRRRERRLERADELERRAYAVLGLEP